MKNSATSRMTKGGMDTNLYSTTTNYENIKEGDRVFVILGPYAGREKYYGIVDVIKPTELFITFHNAKTGKKVSGSEQMVYDYVVPYTKHNSKMKTGGTVKDRMAQAGYLPKPEFIDPILDLNYFPYKKAFFDRFTHEYDILSSLSEDQWREYFSYAARKGMNVRYDQVEDAYIVSNPKGAGKYYGTSQMATFDNGGLIDQMRGNIPKLKLALENPTLSESAKQNIKERLQYLEKTVTNYDAFREKRSKIKSDAPKEETVEVTQEGITEQTHVPTENRPSPHEEKYYIIVELNTKQKVKDGLWYRNVPYTSIRQPKGANMLIVEGKENLDIAYDLYSKYREKLGIGARRKEAVTGVYDPTQHRMAAAEGMRIASNPHRYYWRYKTNKAKDKNQFIKSKPFRTIDEAKTFVSSNKDTIKAGSLYDVLQDRKLVVLYQDGNFKTGDITERAKEGSRIRKQKSPTERMKNTKKIRSATMRMKKETSY